MDQEYTCYILLVTKHGRRKEKDISNVRSQSKDKEKIEVLPGTLLNCVEHNGVSEAVYVTSDLEKPIRLVCTPLEVRGITAMIEQLLKPIPTCKERLEVFNDKDWLNDGQKLKMGDTVYVKLKGEQSEVPGILHFKGMEIPDSKGIIFGVELQEKKGFSDGIFRNKRFFKTEQDYAVFVALHKVRKSREDWQKSIRLRADENGEGLYHQSHNVPCNLSVGERVVWMSDDGPEKGTVQWIGYLPDEPGKSITVGVAFDNPVGTGTGKYKDERLFYAKHGHASLIPLIGLIKEEEFENPGGPPEMGTEEFIKQQHLLLEQIAKSNYGQEAAVQQKMGGPRKDLQVNLARARNHPGAAYANSAMGATAQDIPHYLAEYQYQETNALNPLYERSRLQEALSTKQISGSKLSGSPNFGHGSGQELDTEFSIGSLVEVQTKPPSYGVIRWIGQVEESTKVRLIAGLEMEEELSPGTDGTFKGVRYFTCPPKKALFVPLHTCRQDQRFSASQRKPSHDFGSQSTPDLHGDVAPPEVVDDGDFRIVCGKHKGIQGHHNSCYLDATLFCMFYFTTVFDFIFNRPSRPDDLPEYPQVQKVLKEGIVNPLRKFNYVRADKVLKLRSLLDQLGTIPGMMGEEKDPEEFLSALLTEIMKADPLLHLSSGEHTLFYQLFMEKDENLLLPTTQKLVELSFLQGNVKLKEVPSCLMIQMPRFGKDYKMYHRIVPSLLLDITDILENYPRDCIVCGGLATSECKDCYQVHGPGLNTTAFCEKCEKRSHQHIGRRNHRPQPITTGEDFLQFYRTCKLEELNAKKKQTGGDVDLDDIPYALPREKMELFAVICIQTSHYVSFVKCGSGPKAPWVFFDSMADRMGEQGGYNIPQVVPVPDFADWLAEGSLPNLMKVKDDRDLPEFLRRILCDGYMCMYQNPDIMMYK